MNVYFKIIGKFHHLIQIIYANLVKVAVIWVKKHGDSIQNR